MSFHSCVFCEENTFRSESAWSRAARDGFGAPACWARSASSVMGPVVGFDNEVVDAEVGIDDVEEDVCGRMDIGDEEEDECRELMVLLGKRQTPKNRIGHFCRGFFNARQRCQRISFIHIHSLVATIHSAAIKGTPVIQLLYSHRVPRRRAHSDRPASRRRSPRNTQTLQPTSSPLYSQEMYRSSFLHGSPAYWYLLYWDQTWSHYSFIALPRLKTTALENSHRYLPSTEVCYSPQSVQVCACPPDAHSTAKPRLLTTDRRGAPSPALQSHPIPQTHSP